MRRFELSDEQWQRVEGLLPVSAGESGAVCRQQSIVSGCGLVDRSHGSTVADLQERFGESNSVFQRFNRGAKKGVWQRVFDTLQDHDLE